MLKHTLIFVILTLLIKVCISANTEEVIWENDFSNPIDWVCDYNDIYANGPWVIGNELPGGEFAKFMGTINSETCENGYALFDSDGYGLGINNQNSWMTYKQRIDCSQYNSVVLYFQSYYKKGEADCTVEISNDSINWHEYQVHSDVKLTDCTDNPDFVLLNISSVAANQDSVYVRFRYNGEQGYAWMIDDIVMMQKPQYDLELVDAGIDFFDFPHFYNQDLFWEYYGWHGHYSMIPKHQMESENAEMVFWGIVKNNGTEYANPDIQVTVEDPEGFHIYNDIYTGEPIPPGQSRGMFFCDEAFRIDKPEYGKYYFSFELMPTGHSDAYSYNNHFLDSTEITTNVYARDNNNMTGVCKPSDVNFPYPGYSNDRPAMTFQIATTTNIKGIDIYVPDTLQANFEFLGGRFLEADNYLDSEYIFWINGINVLYIDETGSWLYLPVIYGNHYYEVINNPKLLFMEISLNPLDSWFAVDHSVNTTGHDFLGLHSYDFYPYYHCATPMVRLICEDPQTEKEELKASHSGIKVITNPARENLNLLIDNTLIEENICIYNSLGQKLFTQTANTDRMYFDISSLSTGVYFVGTDKMLYVKRFIVE
jgi:hypothetical protein